MRGRIPEGGSPSVALEIRGFVGDRTAMEAVNMVSGLAGGVWLLRDVDSLALSPAFLKLLRIAPEDFWAAILLAWGIGTALAWFCAPLWRCRAWGMLGSVAMWSFLSILAGLSSDWASIITVLCFAQAAGCLVTYFRLAGYANAAAR